VIVVGTKEFGRKLMYTLQGSRNDDPECPLEEFWALDDVSFEISHGDRVGIIGRNGAGKSTLLKILSRITEPTSGRVGINGRVASLLEVGTGFHPELTGRENIYLNGAILGMNKAEIRKKFDEIVEFSEVERFLDTPVKRYSSGKHVRLDFAVAAHLEPDILVVDEVLAVGDVQFQKKCLGKMKEVGKEGRTVLFVSHQLGAITQFCDKAFLMDKGKLIQRGEVQRVIANYMGMSSSNSGEFVANKASRLKEIAIMNAQSYDEEGNLSVSFSHDQEIIIKIACRIKSPIRGLEVRVAVRDTKRNVITTDTELVTQNGHMPEEMSASMVIPAGLLRPEQYFFTLALYLPNQIIFDIVEEALSVTVSDGGSKYAASEGLDYGCVFVDCKWTIERLDAPRFLQMLQG
jgi:lipopolysaccharide transport system ATP-binding protein